MNQHSWVMGGKNSTKLLIILGFVVVVLVIAASAAAILMGNKTAPNAATEGCDDQTGKQETTMIYKANEEFGPDCLRVSVGTKITYKNESTAPLDVATDPHPTHTGDRQVSGGAFDLAVEPGKTATVTLSKKGEFGIHNHQNASARAKIIVE